MGLICDEEDPWEEVVMILESRLSRSLGGGCHLFQLDMLVRGQDEAGMAEQGGGQAKVDRHLHVARLQSSARHLSA